MLNMLGIGLRFTAIATPGWLQQTARFCWEWMNWCKGPSLYQPWGWMGALERTRGSALPVSALFSGHSLPVILFSDGLIFSCSSLNVSSSFSDPPRHQYPSLLGFPWLWWSSPGSCCLWQQTRSAPTVILLPSSMPQFPSALLGDKQPLG